MSMFRDVGVFHEKFGLPVAGEFPPTVLDPEAFMFRYQFLQEELHELLGAHRAGDLAGVADALADLVYVALGTAHFYGIPFDDVFAEVQRANMSKERAADVSDPRSKRGSGLDVVKPEGWTPPDIRAVLEGAGDCGGACPTGTTRRIPRHDDQRGSYPEVCVRCGVTPVHRTNRSRVCPDCVRPEEVTK